MTSDAPAQAPRTRRAAVATGYAKGDAARQRLLEAAMAEFADAGFRAATTRRIAEAAGVQLPAIPYYFGHKEGLYLACAEAIADGYHRHMGPAAGRALTALERGDPPAALRDALQALMDTLVSLLVVHADARRWAAFIARETADPGPAYEVLYQRVWEPGAALTARLIAGLRGRAEALPEDRVQALLLIGSLMAFQSGGRVSQRLLGWATVGPEQRQLIADALRRQIDGLAGG